MPADIPRRRDAVHLQQAVQEAPTLARLAALARQSQRNLEIVRQSMPAELRAAVQAGPIDGASWCLLVNGNAAAAKLRQMLPRLLQTLQANGIAVEHIRLKVSGQAR